MRTVSIAANVLQYGTITDLSSLLTRVDELCEAGVTMFVLNAVYDSGLNASGYGYDLWSMPPGLAMSELNRPNQFFGTDQSSFTALDALASKVHGCANGMKFLTWLNPSYFWTGSSAYKNGGADEWFQWRDECETSCAKPDDKDPQPQRALTNTLPGCTKGEGDIAFVYDPDRKKCYASVWYGQPSVDFASTWVKSLRGGLSIWMDHGIDGFILDDPTRYISIGKDASKKQIMQDAISDYVHQYNCTGQPTDKCNHIALLAEVYPDDYSYVAEYHFDGGIAGEDSIRAYYDPLAIYDAIDADGQKGNEAVKVELALRAFDVMHNQGLMRDDGWRALSWMRLQPRNEEFEFDWAPGNMLAQALSASAGYLTAVEFTAKPGGANWWASESYPGEGGAPLVNFLQSIRGNDAFDSKSSRAPAVNNFHGDSNALYGMIRYNALHNGGAALVVANLASKPATYNVQQAFSPQVYDLSHADTLVGGTVTLGPWGFQMYPLQALPRWNKLAEGRSCGDQHAMSYPWGESSWMTFGACLLSCLGTPASDVDCKQVTVRWGTEDNVGLVQCWIHEAKDANHCSIKEGYASFRQDGATEHSKAAEPQRSFIAFVFAFVAMAVVTSM